MRQVALVASEPTTRAVVAAVVSDAVEVCFCDAADLETSGADLVVIVAGSVPPERVTVAAKGRPVIVLGEWKAAPIASALSLPCDHRRFRAAVLDALAGGDANRCLETDREAYRNRRAGFRGVLAGRFLSGLRICQNTVDVELQDISLPSENGPGGIGFVATPEQAQRIDWRPWFRGERVPVEITLATAPGPIPAKIELVRAMLPSPEGPTVRIGGYYRLNDLVHEEWIEAVWFRSQRKEGRRDAGR